MSNTGHPTPLLPEGTGVLRPFAEAGILSETEVQLAGVLVRTVPGVTDEVLLAAALCVRALQLGHVCVDLERVAETVTADKAENVAGKVAGGEVEPAGTSAQITIEELPWPDPAKWAAALVSSDAVAVCDPAVAEANSAVSAGVTRPLVFDGTRIYLERYWRYERQIGAALLDQAGAAGAAWFEEAAIEAALDHYIGTDDGDEPDLQRLGAERALHRRITVLAGGPGTGKTRTVARLLATMYQLTLDADRPLEVALAAPTGKAAARMTEAVHQAVEDADMPPDVKEPLLATEASTIHRLLGYRDGISFRHDHTNPLPHDVVVIDETSMVALPLMARLLDALRPAARLVLVGDPFQLASVEAGAVLGDVVGPASRSDEPVDGPLADGIVVLQRVHRFDADSAIAALADAVRTEDAEGAMEILRDPGQTQVTWVNPADTNQMNDLRTMVADNASRVMSAATDGDARSALELTTEMKVLCGTRHGPHGSYAWRDDIERRLSRATGLATSNRWYVGRPIIITKNDYITGVFNGDTGLVVRRDGARVIVMEAPEDLRTLQPSQVDDVETWWSMTIHKSQGSEFTHAVVSLPNAASRVLTNELLYTGITRGKEQVTVVATEDALRAAITRRVARASGLQSRLWP